MLVAVGSTNPVKVSAVEEVFSRVFGEIEVIPVPVDSGVSAQPMGPEIVRGAEVRAEKAISIAHADYGVGIEGGVLELGSKLYNLGFVIVVDKTGFAGTGTSGWFEIPPSFTSRLRGGEELADIVDSRFGVKGAGRGDGAVGIFTGGRVTRKDLYIHGLYMALIPIMNRLIWK